MSRDHCQKGTRALSYRKGQVLHHPSHAAHIPHPGGVTLTGQQILNTTIGINLHGAQILEPIDEARLLAELLAEGVAQVVGWVGRDEQHGAAHLSQLDGETTRRCRLAHTALAADEDPPQRPLVEDGLQRRLHGIRVVSVDERSRHRVVSEGRGRR